MFFAHKARITGYVASTLIFSTCGYTIKPRLRLSILTKALPITSSKVYSLIPNSIQYPPKNLISLSNSLFKLHQAGFLKFLLQRYLTTKHSFHTYELVRLLETRGLTRKQAVAVMKCMQALFLDSASIIKAQMLSKSELENGTYHFKAALSELRTEIEILRKSDWSALRLETASIQRELEALNAKLKEDSTALKHEIQMDFNTRKAEVRGDQKKLEIKIEEMNNKFTIALGDIRTDIEAVKWETTKHGMIAIFGVGVFALFVMFIISEKNSRKTKETTGTSTPLDSTQVPSL
ncbi:hypothetical protein G9A89_011959 [Geosiphon pyriformis]|nr:hypothetical protein G9A89_011959 [Geosiphon pyriformis]